MPVSEVAQRLSELGIESGWGSNVGRIRSTMLMLGDIIQAPDPETLQASLRLSSGSCTAPMAVSALGMCIVRDVLPGQVWQAAAL